MAQMESKHQFIQSCVPLIKSKIFIPSQASPGGNGGIQAAGGSSATVPKRPPAAGGGSDQFADLPHCSDSAAGGQPTAAHYNTTVQHPAGRGQALHYKYQLAHLFLQYKM